MPVSANGTKLENLVNPQVLADMISAELPNAIRFAPLAVVGRKLEGRAGNTITMPKYGYIGDAVDVAEGEDIPISQMSTTTTQVTVKKAGKGVEITDEAVLSGYGDPVGELKNQLKMAIANKVDNDVLDALKTAKLTASGAMSVATLLSARVKFGEQVNQPAVAVMNSTNYGKIIGEVLNLENTDKVLIDGVVGKVAGLQIAISDKLTDTEAYIVASGALGIEMKRDVQVESDRDIIAKLTVFTADEHYVAYLKDESKAIKVTIA
jgi:HK97 family phage major capsid protein